MEKKILLNISGENLTISGDANQLEMTTEGKYYEQNGVQYIEYEESDGMDDRGAAHTQISVMGDMVALLRRAQTGTTHMVFRQGAKSFNIHSTPAGNMEMGTLPTHMQVHLGEECGELNIEYQLDIGGRYAGTNSLLVSYRNASPGI